MPWICLGLHLWPPPHSGKATFPTVHCAVISKPSIVFIYFHCPPAPAHIINAISAYLFAFISPAVDIHYLFVINLYIYGVSFLSVKYK